MIKANPAPNLSTQPVHPSLFSPSRWQDMLALLQSTEGREYAAVCTGGRRQRRLPSPRPFGGWDKQSPAALIRMLRIVTRRVSEEERRFPR